MGDSSVGQDMRQVWDQTPGSLPHPLFLELTSGNSRQKSQVLRLQKTKKTKQGDMEGEWKCITSDRMTREVLELRPKGEEG